MRRITMAACLLLTMLLPLAGCSSGKLAAPPLRDSITVEYDTAAVTRGDVVRMNAYDAFVRATVENLAFSKDFGSFGELYVSVGDWVEEGDVLASLDRTGYDAALENARTALAAREEHYNADRRKGEIAVSLARIDLEEAQEIGNETNIALASLEVQRLQNELTQLREVYQLETQKLERDIASAEEALQGVELIAPCAGEVVAIQVSNPGTRVSSGTTILTLADHTRLYIQYDGSDSITANYLKDKHIVAKCGSESYELEPILYEQEEYTRLILSGMRPPARFRFKTATEAVPGDFAEVLIYEVERQNVLRVPTNAIYYSGSTAYVYVIHGTEKVYTEVEVGARSNSFVEILSGLEEGEIVYVKQ